MTPIPPAMGRSSAATAPVFFLGILAGFPVRADLAGAVHAVSWPRVPVCPAVAVLLPCWATFDRGRGAGSRPPRMRSGGATFASAPVLRPHPVQRNATKAIIRISAHESESIEVLITLNQPGACALRDGRCLRSIGTAFTFAGLRRLALERMMERLRLLVNARKTRCLRVPEGPLEFLGYRAGRNYRRNTGRGISARAGARGAAAASVARSASWR